MRRAFTIILFLLYLQCAYSQTTRQYDSIKYLISSAKDDSTRFWKTVEIIWGYLSSAPDSASVYAQQNILLGQKMKSDEALHMAYSQYTSLEQINGNYTGALQYGFQSLRMAERMKNFIGVCESHFDLADIYREAGDFEQAINNILKAKSLLESKLNPVFEHEKDTVIASHYVYSLVLLTQIFETFNRLDSAMQYGKKAQDLYSKRFPDSRFFPLILAPVMGNIYSKMGDYSTALSYYREGTTIALGNDGKKDLMDNYVGEAVTFKKMRQLDSSIFYANKVLKLSKVAHFLIKKLEALNLLSEVYKSKHNTDSVAKYLELAIQTKDSLFNQQKIIQMQSLTFNEKMRQQEIEDQREQFQNRLRTYMLSGGLVVLLLLAGILYRNNQQKQKANLKIEKAYSELKSTQSQLIQSEKMASLGELTAGIAHEIQNPLNFVNNFSEVNGELIKELKREASSGNMQEVTEIADDIEANSEKINHHGKRADAIVKGMLQHSRSSSGTKEPSDINRLADEYLRLAYQGFRARDKSFNATFSTAFDSEIDKVNIVPQEIGRVILNLINNAFYAVNERSKQGVAGYEPTVIVGTRRLKDRIEISVKDNGNGMPGSIKDKIFQPFFTTKPTGQGTGLGLSLAYDIVKAHEGEIKVETKEGKGSVFIIQITV